MHVDVIASLTFASFFVDIGRSLREGFFMFWETLWALVLGFTLSGFVQAFVSKDPMQAKLGNHRPGAVGRAAGYGTVSSSCSYAATAMAKSLLAKGADFTSAMVFMMWGMRKTGVRQGMSGSGQSCGMSSGSMAPTDRGKVGVASPGSATEDEEVRLRAENDQLRAERATRTQGEAVTR